MNKDELAENGEKFYNEKLKHILEPNEIGKFVAIEPFIEKYYVNEKSLEAILAGRAEFPDKLFYLMRVGYPAAHKIGGYVKRNR
ncbi:MAG: hypothetical protein H7Z37_16770 [Pyrinomonadaceae bacterium]|nr:hypothetical protein [Pyrinomonadaceae bacterium]